MISSLARKEYLRAERDVLRSNIELLRKIEQRYIELSEDNIFEQIKKHIKIFLNNTF